MTVTTPARDEHGPERVLRLAPHLRRCVAYLLPAWLLVTAGLSAVLMIGGDTPGFRIWPLRLLIVLISLLFFGPCVLSWRYGMRVDDRGIWRRRLFGWDLWAWEAFAAGTVREGPTQSVWLHADKPWYGRKLDYWYLDEADCDWLTERIRQVWMPPEIHASGEIKIWFRSGVRRRYLELSPEGIVLSQRKGGRSRRYEWSEVVQLRVTRFAHWRRDFTKLELELPAGTPAVILLGRPDGDRSNWTGPDAEAVLAYLQQQVGGDRTLITAETGPPLTQDEADRRLKELDRGIREMGRILRYMYLFLLLTCSLWLVCDRDALHVLQWDRSQWFMAARVCFFFGLFGVGVRMVVSSERRRCGQQRTEIESWIAGQQEHSP